MKTVSWNVPTTTDVRVEIVSLRTDRNAAPLAWVLRHCEPTYQGLHEFVYDDLFSVQEIERALEDTDVDHWMHQFWETVTTRHPRVSYLRFVEPDK